MVYQQADPSWLAYVNRYRGMANLSPVAEDKSLSNGDSLHAKYIVKNDILQHDEDPNNAWYTDQGLNAARTSNLVGDFTTSMSDEWAIDAWMQGPFHAVGILDPKLLKVGFGSYREADGGLEMGAAINVISGLGTIPPGISFPIEWPANNKTVNLLQLWLEIPNPLTSCPGYTTPAGLPIILMVGPGDATPVVEAHEFLLGSTQLESCAFSEYDYTNPDSNSQALGRSILNARDTVVLIPRKPLQMGQKYTVILTVSGVTYQWSFSTGPKS
ncbi:MAG: CAP domain-containing protein [Chloroflexi bacterium]|nr:CAP domain-containing protein [Chloroflexota bacterium]